MSGLLFLNSEDFTISKGTKGNILCTAIPGFSLVLFYSNQCPHCAKLLPTFKRLPGTIGGCQFGMLNVSSNKMCVKMSKNTIVPIQYVPLIILYVNGRPFMKYSGEHEENDIKRFILEVAEKINNKQKFSEDSNVKENPRGIPDYSIGLPLYGEDDVTYLEFEEAYSKPKQQRQKSTNSLYGQNDARSAQQQMAASAFRNR